MTTQPVEAQVLYGSIVGNVKDPSQAAVPGATVSITNQSTNASRETITNDEGVYRFPTVQTGTYTLVVSLPGFKEFKQTNVQVSLNNVTRVDVMLQVGEVSEAVTVTSETALLQTDRAEVRTQVTERQLQDLPVTLGRNYQNLFKTLPGFTPPEDAHSIPSNPSRSLVFNVNGASRSINNTRIDGASSTNLWLPHVTAYVPALESIQTVNVVSNSFDAEQGLAGGAAINVQIKSGTNKFHGSLFDHYNDQRFRAKNFFVPPGFQKGFFQYNQYGGTLGGPIKKDKLFFFASYEGTKNRENANMTGSVPTLPLRRGDFSASSNPIYDPLTGNPDGSGRTAFLNKQIPADRMDSAALKILSLLPEPNLPGETRNLFVQKPRSFNRWTVDSKINWNVTDKFNMFWRYSVLDFNVNTQTFFGDLEGPPMPGINAGKGYGNTYNFSVGGNYVITPRLVVDGNFGFVRMNANSEQPSIDKNIGPDLLKIPGTNGGERYQSGWPRFDISSYTVIGVDEHYMPYYRSDDQYQYVVNFNWTRGRHEVRWGMDLYKQNLNHLQPEFVGGSDRGPRGRFDFGTGPTSLRGGPSGNNFNSFASFLLGESTRLGKCVLTVEPFTTRTWEHSFYVRDRWQITPRLTFSYGTRWEYFPIPTRADRGLERYDPNTNKMLIGGVGSVPEDLGVSMSKTMFAPRFGLAYRATKNFVIRAGYGITNDPYALARPMRTNHPTLIELDVVAPSSFQPAGLLRDGIPTVPIPTLGSGIIDIPGNVTAVTLPDKFRRGYVQSWNLMLQKELKWGFVGEAGYVATRQIRQLGFIELNWSPIGGANAGKQLFQKFGRTANTQLVSPLGSSHYDALQARLQRRFSGFYQMDVNYTWGKSIGLAGNDNSDGSLAIQIPQYYYLNRALSGFDRTHNLHILNMTELPFGKGRRWLNSGGFLSYLVGGWQVNNILSFYSGRPFTVSASGNSLNAPGNSQRADQVKDNVEILGGVGPGQAYFDPFAFKPVTEARFGTAAFNRLRGPGVANWDFGLFRQFPIREGMNLQFRIESFNFTNHPHFNNPGANVSNLRLNTDGTIRDLNGFSEITSSFGERQFRAGLRFAF
jgi:hypothetical protein